MDSKLINIRKFKDDGKFKKREKELNQRKIIKGKYKNKQAKNFHHFTNFHQIFNKNKTNKKGMKASKEIVLQQ